MAKVVYFCNFSVRISCCSGELAGRPLVEASPRQTEAATSTSPPSFLYRALISQNTTEKLEQLRNNTTKNYYHVLDILFGQVHYLLSSFRQRDADGCDYDESENYVSLLLRNRMQVDASRTDPKTVF